MKSNLIIAALLLLAISTHAQSKLTKENVQKDSLIKADIIDPAINDAQDEAPDWAALIKTITEKYDATYADRTVTKSIIFYTYGKDWRAFTAAIVKYTDKYEPKDDLKLLNKNAGMILKYSDNKQELEAAKGWSKITIGKDPANTDYKKTFDQLTAKIATK